jgi:hypothetical protein
LDPEKGNPCQYQYTALCTEQLEINSDMYCKVH